MTDYEYMQRLKLVGSEYSDIELKDIYKEYSALQVMLEMHEIKNTQRLVKRVLKLERKRRDMELWVDNIWMLSKLFGAKIASEMLDNTPYGIETLRCDFIKHDINVGRNGKLIYKKYFPHWEFMTGYELFIAVYGVIISSERNGIILYTETWDTEDGSYTDNYIFLGLNGDIIESKNKHQTIVNTERDLIVNLS